MINGIFWLFMNMIGNFFKFIIVFGIIGFILLLPFLLKGGWLLGLLIYGFIGISIITFIIDYYYKTRTSFEEEMNKIEKDSISRR